MNANHCRAKQNRNIRFLPIEPVTAVLLRPVSLAAHTNLVVFVGDDWCTQSDATHREALKLADWPEQWRGRERRGSSGSFRTQGNFAAVHYANQADRFD